MPRLARAGPEIGQVLRRAGQRRAAAHQLPGSSGPVSRLLARPYLDRCDRELAACGLAPANRSTFDPSRLTAQESAVTHTYARLNINSRAVLAAQFRDVAQPPIDQPPDDFLSGTGQEWPPNITWPVEPDHRQGAAGPRRPGPATDHLTRGRVPSEPTASDHGPRELNEFFDGFVTPRDEF